MLTSPSFSLINLLAGNSKDLLLFRGLSVTAGVVRLLENPLDFVDVVHEFAYHMVPLKRVVLVEGLSLEGGLLGGDSFRLMDLLTDEALQLPVGILAIGHYSPIKFKFEIIEANLINLKLNCENVSKAAAT